MENKFDVIVHQMILHQPCSLQVYVSSIAAQQTPTVDDLQAATSSPSSFSQK